MICDITNALRKNNISELSPDDWKYINTIIMTDNIDADTAVDRWMALDAEYKLASMNEEKTVITEERRTTVFLAIEEAMKMNDDSYVDVGPMLNVDYDLNNISNATEIIPVTLTRKTIDSIAIEWK